MSGIDRRRFLGVGVAAVAGAVGSRLRFGPGRRGWVRAVAVRGTERTALTSTPGDLVGAYFADATGTRHIGAAYLTAFPADADATVLLSGVAPPDADPTAWWSTLDQPGLARRVRSASHRDFANGDVVDLDGWQIAHTEARLAALWVQTRP